MIDEALTDYSAMIRNFGTEISQETPLGKPECPERVDPLVKICLQAVERRSIVVAEPLAQFDLTPVKVRVGTSAANAPLLAKWL